MQAAVTAPVAPGATVDKKACLAKLRSFCCSRVELAAARCTEVYTASTLQADSDVWNFRISRAHHSHHTLIQVYSEVYFLGEKARVELRTQIQAIHYIQVCRSPLSPPPARSLSPLEHCYNGPESRRGRFIPIGYDVNRAPLCHLQQCQNGLTPCQNGIVAEVAA